jgi:hypothetical protein
MQLLSGSCLRHWTETGRLFTERFGRLADLTASEPPDSFETVGNFQLNERAQWPKPPLRP